MQQADVTEKVLEKEHMEAKKDVPEGISETFMKVMEAQTRTVEDVVT